jgi:hypothetical protein
VTDAQDCRTDDDHDTTSSSKSFVPCPSCGQVMRRGPRIPPNEHGPP